MAKQTDGASSATPSDGADARRAALVVAVSEYGDTTLRQLRSPAGDAEEFGQVLGNTDLGGFEVTTVLDGRASEIRLAVEEFLTACGPEDLALVYLSSHGLVDARRRLYFAATDTLKDRLASTGVEARWLLDQLEECRARRQLVILDCCFSGAFATGSKGDNTVELGDELLGQGRGRVVLTASRATEYSFEGAPTDDSVPGSVFTAALATGIRTGAADADDDGYISVDDAYAYAFDEMRAAGAQQTPQRWLYGAEGDIVLARNPTAATTVGATPTRRPDVLPASTASRSATTAFPSRSGWRSRALGKRSGPLFVATAATAAVAVVAAGWAVWRAGTGADDAEFAFRGGRYVNTSVPWHLTVSDRIESVNPGAPDHGCTVKVRDKTKSGRVVEATRAAWQESVTWQLRHVGSFYLDFEKGCLVNADKGGGDASYPVTITAGVGDSLAWNPSGPVEITAKESSSLPCDVRIVNSETGGLDLVTVKSADDTQTYDPPDTSALYMSVSGKCIVTARDAETSG